MVNIITYAVSTVLTYIFGVISKNNNWNEDLPIPVQNILIGIVVFALSVLATYLLKEPIDVKSIAEQVIVALGGAGSATLFYDTKKIGE